MDNATKEVQPSTTRPLPTSMDWFRQSANWLVGLSLAALAWLGGRYGARTGHESVPLEVLYATTALAFVVAVLCGIGFYHWLTHFASLYEREVPGTSAQQPVATATVTDSKTQTQKTPREKARAAYGWYFNVLKFAFPLGVLLSIATIVTERFIPSRYVPMESVLLIDGRAQDSTRVGFSVLKLDTKSGLVLELFNDSANGWVRWDTCHALAREVKGSDQVSVR